MISAVALSFRATGLREPKLPVHDQKSVHFETPVGTLWGTRGDSRAASSLVRLSHADQGYLSDCFLAATIGALALKRPSLFANMVHMHGPDEVDVELPDGTVHMNATLPIRDGLIQYEASGGNKVLWPAYVEKALALKRISGYSTLDQGGDVAKAFKWLTGVRPHAVAPPAENGVLEDIREQLRAGHPVVVGSHEYRSDSKKGREMHRLNVVGDHCYIVTGVGGHSGDLHVNLWNPWGFEHPKPLSEKQFRRLFDDVTTDEIDYSIDSTRY